MNKNLIKNIILSALSVLVLSFTLEDFDIYKNIMLFFASFSFFCIWDYFLSNLSIKRITKEQDEILHPVTENTTILHLCNVQKHYGKKYHDRFVEKCDCGSTLFRVYNEDVDKGTYVQFICAKCNQKTTGLEFNWKVK